MKLIKGKDIIGKFFFRIELKSGFHLIGYCRYCLHSDFNWFNNLL